MKTTASALRATYTVQGANIDLPRRLCWLVPVLLPGSSIGNQPDVKPRASSVAEGVVIFVA